MKYEKEVIITEKLNHELIGLKTEIKFLSESNPNCIKNNK